MNLQPPFLILMEQRPREFNSTASKCLAGGMGFLEKTLSYLSSLSTDPLFSTIVTLYALILFYFPRLFLGIVFSPVLISTGILLLTLLRLGAIQRIQNEFNSPQLLAPAHHDSTAEDCKRVSTDSCFDPKTVMDLDWNSDPNPAYTDSFVEWNVGAPLEVIYEGYEGEEDGRNDNVPNQREETRVSSMERYPSLSLYYPESDSDSSSGGDFAGTGDWDSPENVCFRWDEEDREGLIEIALDGKNTRELFHGEEDNLIEIDIFPDRTPARNGRFPGGV